MAEETENVDKMLLELREKLAPALMDLGKTETQFSDGFLKRWIRGRNNNLGHASKGIIKTLKWRLANGIDGILEEKFEDVFCPFQQKVIAQDLEGRPVILVQTTDELFEYTEKQLKKKAKEGLKNKARSQRFAVFQAETLQGVAESSTNTNSVIILDMKGVEVGSYIKHVKSALPMVMELMDVSEEHYPGILHSLYIINGPKKSLKMILGIVAPAISSAARKKIHIFGNKKDKYGPALCAIIDPNQLPVELGGLKNETFEK